MTRCSALGRIGIENARLILMASMSGKEELAQRQAQPEDPEEEPSLELEPSNPFGQISMESEVAQTIGQAPEHGEPASAEAVIEQVTIELPRDTVKVKALSTSPSSVIKKVESPRETAKAENSNETQTTLLGSQNTEAITESEEVEQLTTPPFTSEKVILQPQPVTEIIANIISPGIASSPIEALPVAILSATVETPIRKNFFIAVNKKEEIPMKLLPTIAKEAPYLAIGKHEEPTGSAEPEPPATVIAPQKLLTTEVACESSPPFAHIAEKIEVVVGEVKAEITPTIEVIIEDSPSPMLIETNVETSYIVETSKAELSETLTPLFEMTELGYTSSESEGGIETPVDTEPEVTKNDVEEATGTNIENEGTHELKIQPKVIMGLLANVEETARRLIGKLALFQFAP